MASPLATPDAPRLAALLPPLWRETVRAYLHDDAPSFDVGGFVVGEAPREARLLCKHLGAAPCVLAGRPFFDQVFAELGCSVEWKFEEGSLLGGGRAAASAAAGADAGADASAAAAASTAAADGTAAAADGGAKAAPILVAVVRGPVNRLLLGERTALNILSRASGVATQAHALASLARAAGWHGEVAGTRKTTPGFRAVEKYALLVGGCGTHRMDLSAMTMLKDNHGVCAS
jgi:nicotinate-nucleotide pyrophosphorylase (carboxylating)